MESDHHSQYPQKQQMNSSHLMRYRSAPGSHFSDFVDHPHGYVEAARPSSPEADGLIAQFLSKDSSSSSPPGEEFDEVWKNSSSQELRTEFMESPPMMYQSSSQGPPLLNQSSKETLSGSSMHGNPYGTVASMVEPKMGGPKNSNLVRHSSSPAGLFSHLNVDKGRGMVRGMGNFRSINGTNGEPSASRLKGHINFSSGLMTHSHLSDSGNESLGANISENGSLVSWEDMGALPENFTGLKRAREDDRKIYSGLNPTKIQHGEPGTPASSPVLSRHTSLPNTSSEMASVEKYLRFQEDSVVVPCKVRAKRGCATHPRSIAERVRRTRISERMRKLQVLVPNMDEQTSIADMLGLATEYIKELQKQVKILSDNRARCTCSDNRKS